ncbi:MAG: PsiF family protein [Casimicrobiaceae bacterium]
MKIRLTVLAMFSGIAFACAPAFAADKAEKAANPQQNKMKMCQTQAGDKKLEGKDRQTYVNDCLKAKPEKKESKMAMCNKKTAGLKGDERSKAQSDCMKGG